ncbi:hypothetical protein ABFY57_00375 [Paenibacillus polymyxa]
MTTSSDPVLAPGTVIKGKWKRVAMSSSACWAGERTELYIW